ncbi:MAG: PsbP-related protein [Acidobacteriota bacterium]|nr:PsbP-related protein [Acidobacteriota bacterium]
MWLSVAAWNKHLKMMIPLRNLKGGFFTYENAQYGVRIKYPDNWTKNENYVANSIVTFFPDSNDTLKGRFSVPVLELEESMDMEWFKQAHIENLSLILTDFNITYNASTTLAGFSGYTLIFTFRQGTYTLKQRKIWTIENNTLYLLTYSVDQNLYSDYVSVVEQMVNSFEIL